MNTHRVFQLALCLSVIWLFAITPVCPRAQESAVNDGVNWLLANQDISGFWGMDKETPFRDAAVVLDILGRLNADTAAINNGLKAVHSIRINSADYLARKIIAVVPISGGSVPSYLVDGLANMQNLDGGWGYQKGYGSNNLETALALRGLKAASYSNMSRLGQGVSYLISQQNPDSGWSFVTGDSSRVFYTAHAIIALTALQGDFSVSTQIRRGVNWLKTQAHPDGGFGTGTNSNPYETGLAMAALVKGSYSGPEITKAMNYLETTQLPNGSWNVDAYSTAKAIYGLNHVGPDLAILASEIILSDLTPVDSDLVIISATIRNLGVLLAESILVQIFDGPPDIGGIQIGTDVTISTLAPGGDSTIQVEWDTYLRAGDHNILVLVDPEKKIREPEKINNTAIKPVHVYFPPDLLIEADDIVFNPAEPDTMDTVIISTTVRNVGEVTATNVILQIWNGDPDAGGTPLFTDTISSITDSSQFTLNLNVGNYFNKSGDYLIYACADRNNAIREIYEWNNCNYKTLHVGVIMRAQSLATGLNLVGLPLQPVDAPTSFTMIPQIPNCNEIDGWDRISQKWISAIDIGGGAIIGDDFPIALRDGFFARVTDTSTAVFAGRRVGVHQCTSLRQGLNIVSVPNEDACYSAFSLIDDIDSCVEAHRWDKSLQMWVSAVKIAEGVFIGEDFPVNPGNGYFVKVNQAGQWCTRTCDTLPIPELPDLLVIPDYIWLDPNPVGSGDTVGIYVNMDNIGTDTANTPRLDIYMGNPDAGGVLLATGNLPINIPPGGSSGYWGGKFVLTGSGFVDIFGIADHYNAIQEIDETNNQAYKTLQITTSLVVSNTRLIDDGQSPSKPVSSLNNGRGKSLRLNPELVPAKPQIRPSVLVSEKYPTVNGSPKTSSSLKVTKIDNVSLGNHSSSSVTITWTTDGLADGCIHYGTTSALGLTRCHQGPESEIHMVVLDNLLESTPYYFEIVSGGITDNNQGSYYPFTTTQSGAGIPAIIYGQVKKSGTNTAISNILVSGWLRRGGIYSYPLIGLTNSEGIWILNLGNLKSAISNQVLPYAIGDTIFLQLQGGSNGTGADTILISNTSPQNSGIQEIRTTTHVVESAGTRPDHYYLSANYPNPFNSSTMIKFGLPEAGHVELSIYNILGQKVITLLNQDLQAGNHVAIWNGQEANGQSVSSGIYFYRLKSGGFAQTRKMLLMK